MLREKTIKNMLKKIENITTSSIKKKITPYFSDCEILKIRSGTLKQKKYRYFNVATGKEIKNQKKLKNVKTIFYSYSSTMFKYERCTDLFNEAKKYFFIYYKDEILYFFAIKYTDVYNFPAKENKLAPDCFEKFNIENKFEINDQVYVFDIKNKQAAVLIKNREGKDFFIMSLADTMLSKNKIVNFSKINEDNILYARNNYPEIKKIKDFKSLSHLITDLIKKNSPQETVNKSMSLIKAKAYINKVSSFDKITERINNYLPNYYQNDYLGNLSIACKETNKTVKVNTNDIEAVNMFERGQCPCCGKEHFFLDYYTKDNTAKIYFELLPDKNILFFIRNDFLEEKAYKIFEITRNGIKNIYKNCDFVGFYYSIVNKPEEIREIFDNSNVSEFKLYDALGINPQHYERKVEPNICKQTILKVWQLPFNIINRFILFMMEPFAYEALIKYGSCVVQQALDEKTFYETSEKFDSVEGILRFSSEIILNTSREDIFKDSYLLESANEIYKQRPDDVKTICRWVKNNMCHTFDDIIYPTLEKISHISFKRFAEYLDDCKNEQGLCISESLPIYSDYILLVSKLGYDLQNESIIFPNSLKLRHNIAVRAYNASIDEKNISDFSKEYKKTSKEFEYKENAYIVVFPEKSQELIDEGRKQNHCIAAYIEKINNGKSIICFIRKADNPGEPLYAVEILPESKVITQIKGSENKNPDESEVLAFIERWLKTKKLTWKH